MIPNYIKLFKEKCIHTNHYFKFICNIRLMYFIFDLTTKYSFFSVSF